MADATGCLAKASIKAEQLFAGIFTNPVFLKTTSDALYLHLSLLPVYGYDFSVSIPSCWV